MNRMTRNFFAFLMGLVASVWAGFASAAVSADITTALTTAGTDAQTLGVAVLVVIVGIFAIKLLRKSL